MDSFQAIHGTIKTIEGPPNLGIHLPLGTKLSNSNGTNGNSSNNKDGGNNGGHDNREKKLSSSPMKKITSEHNNPSDSGFKCAECNNLFTSREIFMAHMKHEHGKVSDLPLYDTTIKMGQYLTLIT